MSSALRATAQADPADAGWQQLVKAAQAEGKVEVALAGQVPLKLRPGLREFEKAYGIKVNPHTGHSNDFASRILAERSVGRYTLDARIGGANTALVQLMPAKALDRLDKLLVAPEVVDQSLWFRGRHYYSDAQGQYILAFGVSPSYNVSINTKLVKADEITSYADLLNPKWKGKIVSWSPSDQGTAASSIPLFLNPKVGETWFRRWASEMQITIVKDPRQGAEWVAMGRFPIGMFGLNTQAEEMAQQGFPIRGWLPPMAEGEILSSSAANLMVMGNAPNPNATKLFVNWFLGREGQAMFIKYAEKMDTLRIDLPDDLVPEQHRIRADRDYMLPFADPDYAAKQNEVLGALKKIMQDAGYR
jgi:iron(III) transport system substrate-binding protein